jgi:hypothetical protein
LTDHATECGSFTLRGQIRERDSVYDQAGVVAENVREIRDRVSARFAEPFEVIVVSGGFGRRHGGAVAQERAAKLRGARHLGGLLPAEDPRLLPATPGREQGLRLARTRGVQPRGRRRRGERSRAAAGAAEESTAEILAFLEPGADPSANWLSSSVPFFARREIDAVVTPQLAPAGGSLRARGAAVQVALFAAFHDSPRQLLAADIALALLLLAVEVVASVRIPAAQPLGASGRDAQTSS